MTHITFKASTPAIVTLAFACVTLQACTFTRATPDTPPMSPLLASSNMTYMESQHQRALLLSTTQDTPSRRTKKPLSKPIKTAQKQRTKPQPKRPLPALSTLKKESIGATQNDDQKLLSALEQHLEKHNSKLISKKKEITSLSELYTRCKKLNRIHFKQLTQGDIVFFHNTTDANNDGRNNDWYTFAAIVQSPPDSTHSATLVHPLKRSKHISINLKYPDMYSTEGGAVLNSHIRQPHKKDLPYTRYLSGELFAGACAIK